MNKTDQYVKSLNEDFNLSLTGIYPHTGKTQVNLDKYNRVIVKDFGNGLGRVIYIDNQNRLVANNMEKL
ncbi:hypothetical protein SB781_31635 [Paraburkholderia sp. SIMBA_061]